VQLARNALCHSIQFAKINLSLGADVTIPFLKRPDLTEITNILKNGDVSIIVAPSNSGKSTGVLTALQCEGYAKPSRGVVYLSLRENASDEIPDKLGEAVGYTKEEGMWHYL
jgi:ABC-type protease/lipase transport system fused ATPase/permease subunit